MRHQEDANRSEPKSNVKSVSPPTIWFNLKVKDLALFCALLLKQEEGEEEVKNYDYDHDEDGGGSASDECCRSDLTRSLVRLCFTLLDLCWICNFCYIFYPTTNLFACALVDVDFVLTKLPSCFA